MDGNSHINSKLDSARGVDIITAICIVILIELIAFTGIIPAFWGAILQEVVDLITILLALLAKTKPTNPKQTGLEK